MIEESKIKVDTRNTTPVVWPIALYGCRALPVWYGCAHAGRWWLQLSGREGGLGSVSPPYFSLICNTVYSNKDRNVSAFIAVFLGSKVFIFLWEDISNKFWSGSLSRLVSIFVVQLFRFSSKLRDWVTNLAPKRRSIRGQSSFHCALLAMTTCFDCLVRLCFLLSWLVGLRYCIIATSGSSTECQWSQT